MENALQQLMESVGKLVEGQAQLINGQSQIIKRLDHLEEGQANLVEGQSQIVKRLDIIDNHLVKIDTRIQDNTNIITTLSVDMARSVTKKDTDTIDNKIKVLNNTLFEQEAKTLILLK